MPMGFDESLINGALGELIVVDFLLKIKGIKSVVDVRDDKYFQSVDVDYLIEDLNGQFKWVEVKTDFKGHETGKIVYEMSTSGNIGCFEKTKAEYVAYYIIHSGNLYMLKVSNLREYINDNNLKLIRMGDNATGYLLDIAELERAGVIVNEYKTKFAPKEKG